MESGGSENSDSFLQQLQTAFAYLEKTQQKSPSPHALVHALRDMDGNRIDTTQQQDAIEFFNLFCARFEETASDHGAGVNGRNILETVLEAHWNIN